MSLMLGVANKSVMLNVIMLRATIRVSQIVMLVLILNVILPSVTLLNVVEPKQTDKHT